MKGSLSVTKTQVSLGKRQLSIVLRDEASRVQFVEITVSLEDFMDCLTGHHLDSVDFEVRNLSWVGKKKVMEKRQIVCPLKGFKNSYSKTELQEWLLKNAQEEGWIINPFLGSQSSVKWDGDKAILNYTVYKFVDPTPE